MELEEVLEQCLGQNLVHMIISNPKKGDFAGKVDVRCYEDKGTLMFQFARYQNNQVFHLNYAKEEAKNYILSELVPIYRQMQFFTTEKQYTILISKKGKITIKGKNKKSEKPLVLSHNRKKKYILPENEPIPFLIELGVQAEDGRIRDKKQKKFRQINRFLEFIRDVSDKLPKDKELTIVDFGCGKSYLTFAMYYYLKIMNGYRVRMIGLDLKSDVIQHCNELAKRFGYEELTFLEGDISSFEGVNQVDMVVTLHACDTATDFALDKAIRWGAKVILSVPCCQHEVNAQLKNDRMQPIFKYGIIKERMAALMTDALRANWANLSTYFKYPEAVRTLIYTTNAIEGFNRQLRKVTKSKSVFPTDDSLLKMLYLAMIDITKKWTGKRKDWGQIHSQLEIFFADRLPQ